ncbi:hypothetical protein DBB29_24920 [Pandoraea cepalis]|uniref:Transposase n=1 Tax=Pandoraea cepalis TaxID=2508294 RepID=A0AAW7MGY5_9BURK|nr:hypothetical protein [Pandoraea cepalis]MDN4581359.1 hypothetical protein [Pandoraea cepalis]
MARKPGPARRVTPYTFGSQVDRHHRAQPPRWQLHLAVASGCQCYFAAVGPQHGPTARRVPSRRGASP